MTAVPPKKENTSFRVTILIKCCGVGREKQGQVSWVIFIFLLKTFSTLALCQYLLVINSYPLWLEHAHNTIPGSLQSTKLKPATCDIDSSYPQRKAKFVDCQYPRSGSVIIVLIKRNIPNDGKVVINADSTVKRLWIQIPVSPLTHYLGKVTRLL